MWFLASKNRSREGHGQCVDAIQYTSVGGVGGNVTGKWRTRYRIIACDCTSWRPSMQSSGTEPNIRAPDSRNAWKCSWKIVMNRCSFISGNLYMKKKCLQVAQVRTGSDKCLISAGNPGTCSSYSSPQNASINRIGSQRPRPFQYVSVVFISSFSLKVHLIKNDVNNVDLGASLIGAN